MRFMNTYSRSSVVGRISVLKKWQLLFSIFTVITLLSIPYTNTIRRMFFTNLGWIYLVRGSQVHSSPEVLLQKSQYFFQLARTTIPMPRVSLGEGMALLWQGQDMAALQVWEKGEIEEPILLQLGHSAVDAKRWNQAIIYFIGAGSRVTENNVEGWASAGQVCQLMLSQPHILSKTNASYCQKYFQRNENNLVVNGDFISGEMFGWRTGQAVTSDQWNFVADSKLGMPLPAARIEVYDGARAVGPYQVLNLTPGDTVRFMAHIRIVGRGTFTANLLQIGWQNAGKPQGNAARQIQKSTEWIFIERTFTLPVGSESHVLLFPVLLEGQATAWFDNVRIEFYEAYEP